MALCYPRARTKILSLFLISWATFISSYKIEVSSDKIEGSSSETKAPSNETDVSDKTDQGAMTLDFKTNKDGSIICNFYGSSQHLVTEEELKAFDLDDVKCPAAMVHYFGENTPDSCFFGHAKHEDDTNQTFFKNGWILPFAIYHVRNATMIGRERKELIAAHAFWDNSYGLRTYIKVHDKRAYENTISHLNRSGNKFGAGSTVKVKVPEFAEAGYELTYEHEWGTEQTESTKQVLEIGGEAYLTLNPFTKATINLTAWQEVWTFQVTYAVNLGGHVIANFGPKFYGAHYWHVDLNAISGGPRYYTEMVRLNKIENSNTAIGSGGGYD